MKKNLLLNSWSYENHQANIVPPSKQKNNHGQEALLLKFKIFYNVLVGTDSHNPEIGDQNKYLWDKFQEILSDSHPHHFDAFIEQVKTNTEKSRQKKKIKTSNQSKNKEIAYERKIHARSQFQTFSQKNKPKNVNKFNSLTKINVKEEKINSGLVMKREIGQIKTILTHGHKFIST